MNQVDEVNQPENQFIEGRRKLPRRRRNATIKVKLGRSSFFFNVGYYEDKKPGEVFIDNMKTGTDISDMMNAISLLISLALQYGCPAEKIIKAFRSFKEGGIPKTIASLLEKSIEPGFYENPYGEAEIKIPEFDSEETT